MDKRRIYFQHILPCVQGSKQSMAGRKEGWRRKVERRKEPAQGLLSGLVGRECNCPAFADSLTTFQTQHLPSLRTMGCSPSPSKESLTWLPVLSPFADRPHSATTGCYPNIGTCAPYIPFCLQILERVLLAIFLPSFFSSPADFSVDIKK